MPSGSVVPEPSKDAARFTAEEVKAAVGGWFAGGRGELPRAWETVSTAVVPLAVLAASHVTNCSKRVGLMVSVGSVPTAMWWKVS